MDINLIRYIFIFITCIMTIIGALTLYGEKYLLPICIERSFRYGKFGINTHQPLVEKLEVPKRWFKHFYIFAAPVSTGSLILLFHKYVLDGTVPEIVNSVLDISLGRPRKVLVSLECTCLAMILFTTHCWKRLYECYCVNVFSDKKINIFHYILGYMHYIGTILCIIGESDGFVRDSIAPIALDKLTFWHIAWANFFLWSTLQQLKTNFILSNLRKLNNKTVFGYKIPRGGLFVYISGPLQLTEILNYLTLSNILWQSSTFHYITIWVVVNQTISATLSHKWYQATFRNYPKQRKILIPYIY